MKQAPIIRRGGRWGTAASRGIFGIEVSKQLRLAQQHYAQHQLSRAETLFRGVLEVTPDSREALEFLAVICLQTRRPGEALALLHRLVRACPAEPLYCDRLAALLERQGEPEQAMDCYARLLEIEPGLAESRFNYARLLKRHGRLEAALAQYEMALEQGISRPEEVYSNLSVVLTELRRDEGARAALEQALRINPEFVPALYNLALLHEELGDWESARAVLERILALQPGHVDALVRLANGQPITEREHELVARLERAEKAAQGPSPERENLRFALGKVLDECGDYAAAFRYYQGGNLDSRRRVGAYRRNDQERMFSEIRKHFTPGALGSVGAVSEEPLIFICGMFRSGSTLLEQALAAHPQLASGGEVSFFAQRAPLPEALSLSAPKLRDLGAAYVRYLSDHFPGGLRVTDKRPDNFLYLGLLHTLFPRARFIHTRRAALDTCLSNYFQQFEAPLTWQTDLLDIGHFYVQHQRLMEHWQAEFGDAIAVVDYEQLVETPQAALQSVLSFLGLDWDEACLSFNRVRTRVRTASVTQVRQPLYLSSCGRWRNYSQALQPLREYFGSAGVEV